MVNNYSAIHYVLYFRNPIGYYKLDAKALEIQSQVRIYDELEEDDRPVIYLYFGDTPKRWKEII